MKLVVDANIIFAAFIKSRSTTALILSREHQLFAPQFLIEEIYKYKQELVNKSGASPELFDGLIEDLLDHILFLPKEKLLTLKKTAMRISPDPNDWPYFACALAIKAALWSNDKALTLQTYVKVYSTSALLQK